MNDVSFISLKEDVLEGVAANPANFNYLSKNDTTVPHLLITTIQS